MIIRDIVINRKRKLNRILLKRISSKFDRLENAARAQSMSFNQLLEILSKYEDRDDL